VFGDLGSKPAFVEALALQLERLRTLGVLGALEALEQDAAREDSAQPVPAA
jgi:fructuronate reductase